MKKRFFKLAMIGWIGCFSIWGCNATKPMETQAMLSDDLDGPLPPVATTAAVETTAPVPTTEPQTIDVTINIGDVGRPDLANIKLDVMDTDYTNNNISVTYPQIVGLGDEKAQSFANQVLYEHMKSAVDHYVKDPDHDTLTLTYETITLYRGQYTVLYKGLYKAAASDEPVQIAFTDNLNLITCSNIRLSSRISKSFLKKSIFETKDYTITESNALRDSYVTSYLESESEEYFDALVDNADFGSAAFPNAFSYSKGDEIRIIVMVPHLIGDYIELSLVQKTK